MCNRGAEFSARSGKSSAFARAADDHGADVAIPVGNLGAEQSDEKIYKGAYHYPHEQYPKEFTVHVQEFMNR